MNEDSSNWIDRLIGGGSSVSDTFQSLDQLFDTLTDPRTYLRAFMVVFGIVILLAALRY